MILKSKVKNSLKASFWDGVFSSCMQGFSAEYIVPFALILKANSSQIGFLSALPSLFSSLAQLKSASLLEKIGKRKLLVVCCVFLQASIGVIIILTPLLFSNYAIVALICAVTLFNASNAIALPVWLGWMSSYLPANKRGAYFGWRNKVLGVFTIASLFIAGFILQINKNNGLKGFFIIFSIAAICRYISCYFLTVMYEPKYHINKDAYFSFWDFVRGVKESNFAKFVLFVSLFSFCVNVSSPFVSVFMLKDLKFDYITYTILVTTVTIFTILTIQRWGKLADRVGNWKILKRCALIISFLPLLWLINHNPIFLFLVQAFGGAVWAGFNLCAINFVYDVASEQKRVRCMAYFYVCNGVGVFLGALLGGFLAKHMPLLLGFKLLSLFVLSAILRLLVVVIFKNKINEVRPVEKLSTKKLFYSIIGLKPVA